MRRISEDGARVHFDYVRLVYIQDRVILVAVNSAWWWWWLDLLAGGPDSSGWRIYLR